jgi:hypothetical protein
MTTNAQPTTYRCPYCARTSHHEQDLANRYCSCCGSLGPELPKPCEHPRRDGFRLWEMWQAGVTSIRREPWAEGNYLDLVPLWGGYATFGMLHSGIDAVDVPPHIRRGPIEVSLLGLPDDGWQPYDGPPCSPTCGEGR